MMICAWRPIYGLSIKLLTVAIVATKLLKTRFHVRSSVRTVARKRLEQF